VVASELWGQQQSPFNRYSVNLAGHFRGEGTVIWRARNGSGPIGADFHYVQVRRPALFIKHSLKQGLQRSVFELHPSCLTPRVSGEGLEKWP